MPLHGRKEMRTQDMEAKAEGKRQRHGSEQCRVAMVVSVHGQLPERLWSQRAGILEAETKGVCVGRGPAKGACRRLRALERESRAVTGPWDWPVGLARGSLLLHGRCSHVSRGSACHLTLAERAVIDQVVSVQPDG